MKRAALNADATVVSSFTVTFSGGVEPRTDNNTKVSLALLLPADLGVPPLA